MHQIKVMLITLEEKFPQIGKVQIYQSTKKMTLDLVLLLIQTSLVAKVSKIAIK